MDLDDLPLPEPQPLVPLWMITFADLLSLMLSFFVLMFTMTSVPSAKWQPVVESLTEHLNPHRAGASDEDGPHKSSAFIPRQAGKNLDYLELLLRQKMAGDPVLAQSYLHHLSDRLVISLPAELLFERGSTALNPAARAASARLGQAIRYIGNDVTVAGHADPDPLSGTGWPSNWELSLGRALAVTEAMQHEGLSRHVKVLGMGESHYRELDKNLPQETRFRIARRVDIVIEDLRTKTPGS